MATHFSDLLYDNINRSIAEAIDDHIKLREKEIKQQAYANLDKAIEEVLATVALHVSRQMYMERHGEELVIRIKKDDLKEQSND